MIATLSTSAAPRLRVTIFFTLLAAACSLAGPAPLRWQVDVARPQPRDWEVFQGETVILAPLLTAGGAALDLAGETFACYYQTNGMASNWWSFAAAPGDATGEVYATWSPLHDCGAARYTFFISAAGSNGANYRAYGRLAMRSAPGATPSVLPAPTAFTDALALWGSNYVRETVGASGAVWRAEWRAVALTNEQDLAALRTYHYGSPDIIESPANWFEFDGAGTITEYLYEAGREAVVVPWAIDGVPVVSIGQQAFVAYFGWPEDLGDPITSVVLPRCTTNISNAAFFFCTYLAAATLPNVVSIGHNAFTGNLALHSVTFDCDAPTAGLYVYPDYVAVTNYVKSPTATGWGATFCDQPVVRLPLYGDGSGLSGVLQPADVAAHNSNDLAHAGLVRTNQVAPVSFSNLVSFFGNTRYADVATNLNHTLVVSNGHWLIISEAR